MRPVQLNLFAPKRNKCHWCLKPQRPGVADFCSGECAVAWQNRFTLLDPYWRKQPWDVPGAGLL